MKNTVSLCLNYRCRQLYSRGKSQVAPRLVVYAGKNRCKNGENRLGITVSTKIGKAHVRNRVRRKIREAYRLSEEFSVCVRGGLHCAPLMHEALGTSEGGLVRASLSPFNTEKEVELFLTALKFFAVK